ncbi:hypothetical protein NQ314_000377 [Rhamnusium bicolor]|uniref:Metalloendopeptidase n=1 Tax=Rhamnusium bicolor TaxID=1586634 RepID=A0AAV8ZX10_9CUCU|nr:hypothetical protein NQ314_000377 [Rhamnusium bicolor]
MINTFPLRDEENSLEKSTVDLSYLGERVFSQPNPETGKRLESWNETSAENPEEFGEYAEGDIVFPRRGRNGLVAEGLHWKNGVIPYEISGHFRPKLPTDEDYISIVNGRTGCWSSVGRIKGKQEINLQSPSCTTKVGTALHELMHAAGFLHEQNRYERDDYVTIAWQNIKRGHENNFDKADKDMAQGFGVSYDFRSVMHYSSTAFSTNNQPTIIPKDPKKVQKMGQRDGFSRGDITKINNMYNCPEMTLTVIGNGTTTANITTSGSGSENNEKETSNPLVDAAVGLLSIFIH